MLTDIFSVRYADRHLWATVGASQKALLVQCYRLLVEQLIPVKMEGKEDAQGLKRWDSIEKWVSMELGVEELSPRTWGYYDAYKKWNSGTWPAYFAVKNWMLAEVGERDADAFVKERLSFVELSFRDEHDDLAPVFRTP